MTIVGVARLLVAGVHWLPTLLATMSNISRPGAFNDASRLNPFAWHMVNLQYALYGFMTNRPAVNGVALAVTLLLSVMFIVAWRQSQSSSAISRRGDVPPSEQTNPAVRDALAASIPMLICLLPVYHRYYDSLILALTLAWGIALIGTRLNRFAWFAVLSTAPFYVDWQYLVDVLGNGGHVPANVVSSWWWKTLIMPCQVWTLLAIILVLTGALRRMPASSSRGV